MENQKNIKEAALEHVIKIVKKGDYILQLHRHEIKEPNENGIRKNVFIHLYEINMEYYLITDFFYDKNEEKQKYEFNPHKTNTFSLLAFNPSNKNKLYDIEIEKEKVIDFLDNFFDLHENNVKNSSLVSKKNLTTDLTGYYRKLKISSLKEII